MFRAYHGQVWRFLRRRGLPPDVAADVTQQTFVVALERLDDIRPESERAFLIGVALRVAQASSRRQRTSALLDQQTMAALRGAHPHVPGTDLATLDLLDLVLSHVDRDLIDVFVLFELEGFSSPEIARLLEIPIGTVASRLRRAREEFRAIVRRLEITLEREVRGTGSRKGEETR
jgi:RNA polymerase sigma-70 factor (ECF subfamily)